MTPTGFSADVLPSELSPGLFQVVLHGPPGAEDVVFDGLTAEEAHDLADDWVVKGPARMAEED